MDEALVKACVAGDADAWEALRGRYHHAVHAAFRAVGAGEDIEDLEQEVWARLLARDRAALRDFRGGSLSGFLAQVARSVAIDHGRARRARPSFSAEEAHGIVAEGPSAEQEAASKQARGRLAAALDAVAAASDNPARDRDLLRLHFEEEMSPAEIAELGVGLSSRGVESMLRRARGRLRTLLQKP